MQMIPGSGIKTFLITAGVYHANMPLPAENVQVAVDGAQADGGHTDPDLVVDFCGSGVISGLTYGLQNQLALFSQPHEYLFLGMITISKEVCQHKKSLETKIVSRPGEVKL